MKNSEWGPGEWDNEPDAQVWVDEYSGYECQVLRIESLGHLCGYVSFPKSHPCYGINYDKIEVHGGITYSDIDGQEKFRVGFDCAHSGDLVPFTSKIYPIPGEVYRNLEYVKNQVKLLAKQLKELGFNKD